jgi:hypothetical protein
VYSILLRAHFFLTMYFAFAIMYGHAHAATFSEHLPFRTQLFDEIPSFGTKNGYDRAINRRDYHEVRYAESTKETWGVLFAKVPASFHTNKLYPLYVKVELDSNRKLVLRVAATMCACTNKKREFCTHVVAALYTMQDMVYSSGRVPGEYARMLSCTQKLQLWHRPVGNAHPDDLDKDIDVLCPFPSVKRKAKQEDLNAQKKARGEKLDEPEKDPKKRPPLPSYPELYASIAEMGIGEGIDMEKARETLKELIAANRRAQMLKRGARESRESKKKEKAEAAKKVIEAEAAKKAERLKKARAAQAACRNPPNSRKRVDDITD